MIDPTRGPYSRPAAVAPKLVMLVPASPAPRDPAGVTRGLSGERDPGQRCESLSPLGRKAIGIAAAAVPSAVQGRAPPTPCEAAAGGRSRRCAAWRYPRPGPGPAPRSAGDGDRAGVEPEAAGNAGSWCACRNCRGLKAKGTCRSIDHGEIQNVVESVYAPFIVSDNAAQILMSDPDAPETRYKTPLSQYLFSVLRPVFTELVPAEQEYTDAFDRFEHLVSLVQYDLDQFYALGCFVWRDRRQFFAMVGKEIEAARDRWPPLSAGLFGGSLDRLLEAKQAVDAEAERRRWR